MIKLRAVNPYNSQGKPVFKDRLRPGVYVIMKNGRPLYVGFSGTDLYKTMYRHFQSWNDPHQVRVTYNPQDRDIKTRVIYTNTAKQAADLERAIIIKHEPRDNPQKLLNYTTTPAEEKIYTTFEIVPTTPVHEFEGEIPF